MYLVEKFKEKSIGYYCILGATILGLVIAIMYGAFGSSSQTFSAGILVCLIIGIVCGIGLFFYDGFVGDFLVVAIVAMFSLALGLFIINSVGDFTEFITPVGMYGNADNMGMRITLIVMIVVSIIAVIVGGFMSRIRNK